ncbi:wax ester/triacylglycerol synthase family O-acyltransferase [Hoyosella altamirensis]|uniref:Diacylglycerol O-acyltransferase n=1 Tax=Hoyosella altamirensis TaxID=616997 RepID=A0A839RL96_9ACTN|nr:wax ester/triacylglycerol synthase family O-acyltransferase [Hoyosella altamirensis]MBB3036988.1 WS/DGAT/MGAT family acyltransferase [Hoyosella altamirensis]
MPKVAIADRLFLTAESENTPQHVACLATFFLPDDAEDGWVGELAAQLRSQTAFGAPFNYKIHRPALKNLAPKWDVVPDDRIDIDYHFRYTVLPQPGGERELGDFISRQHSCPLDTTRPLWEFYLIEGLERRRFAIYFKVHHALIDAVGGVKKISKMITPFPDSAPVRALWTIGPTPRTTTAGEPVPFANRVRAVRDVIAGTAKTAAGLGRSAGSMIVQGRRRGDYDLAVPFIAPNSVVNGRIGSQRRVATQSYDVSRIRAVAKAAGVTVNDVFLAICAGGLRQYLSEFDNLPLRTLTAGAPVNVRDANDEHTSNAFSMIVVNLGTQIADPAERLRAIARSSSEGKAQLADMPKRASELYPALFMGPFILQNLIGSGGRGAPPYNVSISNVPGPLEQQYLAGAPLEGMYPLGMLYHGLGLFIALFSSSGRLGVGFTGDSGSLPHLQRLAMSTGEALLELEKAFDL